MQGDKNSLMTTTAQPRSIIELDGFGGYVDDTGDSEQQDRVSNRVMIGGKIKFVDPRWTLDGRDITGQRFTVIGMRKVANKWTADGKPLQTQILLPSDHFPDFATLNAQCLKSEWFEKFGKLAGPWQGQRALYFIDKDYNQYTWASPATTTGSAVAIRELMDQIDLVRRLRGANVYPVCVLGHRDWTTKFGVKQRPYLLPVQEWVAIGPQQMQGEALPARDAAPVIEATGAPVDAQRVEPPTRQEEIDDTIPW
jgi:hypothetical protein